MDKQSLLAETTFGDFVFAKINSRLDAADKWLGIAANRHTAIRSVAAGFTIIAAGTEIAANLLEGKEDAKGALQRGALHVGTLISLGGAGLAAHAEGYEKAISHKK